VTITIVLPFINLTGGVRMLLMYANALHDAGHIVTVAYPSWPYRFHFTRRQQWTEFRKHASAGPRVPWFALRARLLRVPFVSTPFLPRADVIVATAWPTAHSVARLGASRGRKVHVVMHHEAGTGPEAWIRRIYSLPFYRVAISQQVRRELKDRFGCDVEEVVPCGVDPSLFYSDGAPEAASVLFLYHPDPRKGAQDGLAAISRLRDRIPGVRVRVCGTVQPPKLPDWASFRFHPPDADLRRMYSESNVLLYPSRYEGFGLPPLEAMACGCPSVTTAVGAIPEFATDRRDALIVRPGDIDAMVARLEEVLSDAALRRRLSEEGKRTADRYSVARTAPLFVAALERASATIALRA
jgi:glycosyltransferase involved in cell wall biosynthesis